jgi:hypothetical protein
MHTSTISRRFSAGALLALLLALPWLSGCDDGTLNAPAIENDLFNSYVAIGNSITAGFQSGGINAETQAESFAVLLANQMNTPFGVPEMATPGCPPPLTQIFPEPQVQGGDPDACAFREEQPPLRLNNVAVPGAAVADVLTNTPQEGAEPNPLTQFILGGQTQVEAARAADPTFVTAWTGNNDVLGAALACNPALATSEEDFTTRYGTMLDELDALPNLQGGVLFGVVDVTAIPNLSAGAAYLAASQQAPAGTFPPNLNIDPATCAPSANGGVGDLMLVPFQYGVALLNVAGALFDQLGGAAPTITLDCAQDLTVEEAVGQAFGGVSNIPPNIQAAIADVRTVSLLQTGEIGTLRTRVQAFNQFIRTQANNRGYAYLNVNAILQRPDISQQIPPFPELFDNPDTPWGPDQPFGPLFSLDGVHPSATTHVVVANEAIQLINETYETNLQPVPSGG